MGKTHKYGHGRSGGGKGSDPEEAINTAAMKHKGKHKEGGKKHREKHAKAGKSV
jgi:hypothetical protein